VLATTQPPDIAHPEDPTLLQRAHYLAGPFAAGAYVDDWATRAQALAALADLGTYGVREDAHWTLDAAATQEGLSLRPTRPGPASWSSDGRLSLNVEFSELEGPARQLVGDATARLDSAEKIVISAAAWCLCELACPPELALDTMNLLYEEALHLEAIGRLLGTDHSQVAWIPADRQSNWDLVRQCETPLDYMFVEHCLYEGRGTVASAAGAFQLERAGAPGEVVDVFAAIARQEANHNVTGFRWLKMLDTGGQPALRRLADLVRQFLAVEPLPQPDGTPRSQRQHFPLYLVDCYQRTGDFYLVKQEIVAASGAARRTGLPGVPVDRLYTAAQATSRWAETMEARSRR